MSKQVDSWSLKDVRKQHPLLLLMTLSEVVADLVVLELRGKKCFVLKQNLQTFTLSLIHI